MNLVYKYANRVVVLNEGNIVFDGDKVDLFASKIYEENHLEKPEVLQMVDYLNDTLGLNLTYHLFDEEELLNQVVKKYE